MEYGIHPVYMIKKNVQEYINIVMFPVSQMWIDLLRFISDICVSGVHKISFIPKSRHRIITTFFVAGWCPLTPSTV